MPRKPKEKSNFTIVREGLGLSQSAFAERLGVSASQIKKVEEGKRPISQDLSARIFAETGVLLLQDGPPDKITYTEADHENWNKEIQLNAKSAQVAARLVLKLVELMLVAAARPGVKKSYQTWNAIIQSLERVKNEFRLEKHIEAELRDRRSTETKLYTIRELRKNDLLAQMVNFKDDPKLKDDEEIPMTKTTGWLPVKELFNIWNHHEQLISELDETDDTKFSEERTAELQQKLSEQIEAEADKFIGKSV